VSVTTIDMGTRLHYKTLQDRQRQVCERYNTISHHITLFRTISITKAYLKGWEKVGNLFEWNFNKVDSRKSRISLLSILPSSPVTVTAAVTGSVSALR
jgi:hypothetical protein